MNSLSTQTVDQLNALESTKYDELLNAQRVVESINNDLIMIRTERSSRRSNTVKKGGKRSKKRRTNKRRRNSRRRSSKRRTSRSQKGGYTPEEINNSAKKVYETFREIPEIMDQKLQIMLKSDANDTELDYKMKNAYFVHIYRIMERPNVEQLINTFKKENTMT
jgi:hypothetical protein